MTIQTQSYTTSNSLIVILPPSYFQANTLAQLKNKFASYGHIESWTVLTSFGRILVVYSTDNEACKAREALDFVSVRRIVESESTSGHRHAAHSPSRLHAFPKSSSLSSISEISLPNDEAGNSKSRQRTGSPCDKASTCMRVFYGPPLVLPLQPLSDSYLSVPELTKNFLVSPPGSPPVDWVPQVEEGPNKVTFPNDENWINVLTSALTNLKSKNESGDRSLAGSSHMRTTSDAETVGGTPRHRRTRTTSSSGSESMSTHIIIEPEDTKPAVSISIIHDDDDEEEDEGAGLGSGSSTSIWEKDRALDEVNKHLNGIPFHQESSGISQVRATVESTLGHLPRPTLRKIQPTPRPGI